MKKIIIQCIFISLLYSIILSLSPDTQTFNLEYSKKIIITNYTSACICVKINPDELKDQKFYIQILSEEKGSSMNSTLDYNFTSDCSNAICENFFFNFNKSYTLSDIREGSGFTYEYEFKRDDESYNYMMMKYYEFNGVNLSVNYLNKSTADTILEFLFIYVGIICIVTIIILALIQVFVLNRKRKDDKSDFIAPLFKIEDKKELGQIKKD